MLADYPKRQIQTLDYRGAPQTIELIKRSVFESQQKPVVRAMVEEITKYLPSKDTVSEALSVYNFVLEKTRYCRDPRNVELVKAPWVVIEQIMGGHVPGLDCDDMTALICGMLASSGAECRAATVAFKNMFYKGERQYSHVYAEAREPRTGAWLTLDPVAGNKTKEMLGRIVAVKYWPIC